MSNAAKSMFVFGVYLFISGATLMVAPNFLFTLLGLPATQEVWARVVGMLTFILGFYFTQAARKELVDFFRWTVYVRFAVIVVFTVFVLLGYVSPVLILFGAVDVLGALWTAWALRSAKVA